MNEVTALAGRSRAINELDPGKLRYWRKIVRLLTQEQLADAAGLSRGEISHLETSRRKPLTTTLSRLCIALECDPADLLVPGSVDRENQNGTKNHQADARTAAGQAPA